MSSNRARLAVLVLVAGFVIPSALAAQAGEPAGHAAAATEAEGDEWHAHPNHLLTFMGGTFDEEQLDYTVGLDYTRQVAPRLALGGFVDYATGSLRELLVGPMMDYFPWKGLYLEAAPAAAVEDGEWHFVTRLGAGYEFEFGSLLVGPFGATDLADGEKALYVLGIAAGVHF